MKTATPHRYLSSALSAVLATVLVCSLGLAPASALDPPRFEEASYVRVAVHRVEHGKMDEYRAAVGHFISSLYQNALYDAHFQYPFVAYRDLAQGVYDPSLGERRVPASAYTFGTALDTPLDLRSWDQEVERAIARNPASAEALDRVMEFVDSQSVLLLERRDDLSTDYARLPRGAKANLSTLRLTARPNHQDAMARALGQLAALQKRAGAHLAVFEVVEGNRGAEYVVVARQGEDLGLTAMPGANSGASDSRAQVLRNLWNTVHRFEKSYIETDREISYWP